MERLEQSSSSSPPPSPIILLILLSTLSPCVQILLIIRILDVIVAFILHRRLKPTNLAAIRTEGIMGRRNIGRRKERLTMKNEDFRSFILLLQPIILS